MNRTTDASANPTVVARRRYLWEFTGSIVAYVVVLVASIAVLNHGVAGPLRVAIAVTPVVPLALVFAAVVRFMLGIDELQRQIHLEALALAAGITALLAVTYGFLEGAGFPRLSAWFTYMCVMVAWLVCQPFVARRYK